MDTVMPAKAGIQGRQPLDSGMRRNDGNTLNGRNRVCA